MTLVGPGGRRITVPESLHWKMKANLEKKRPIIKDGKTLDELVKGKSLFEKMVARHRAEGHSDEEIWEYIKRS